MSVIVGDKIYVEMDIEVNCSECGADLECNSASGGINVIPCPTCLERATKGGYDDGYGSGHADGHSEGYDKGYEAGVEAERDRHEL